MNRFFRWATLFVLLVVAVLFVLPPATHFVGSLEPFTQQAVGVNLFYFAVAIVVLELSFRFFVRLMGRRYRHIMETIERDPLSTALFFGLVFLGISSLPSAFLH